MQMPTHEPNEASSFEHYPRLPPIGAGAGAGLVLSAPSLASTSPRPAGLNGKAGIGAGAGVGSGSGALAQMSGVPLGLVTEVLSRTSADLARVIDFQARVAERQEPDVAHRDRAHQQYRHAYVVVGQLRVGDIFVCFFFFSDVACCYVASLMLSLLKLLFLTRTVLKVQCSK